MRVEISRINGDIYVNGQKIVFAVDFKSGVDVEFANVDWLIGWAKIGMLSKGHDVPHFEIRTIKSHEASALPVPDGSVVLEVRRCGSMRLKEGEFSGGEQVTCDGYRDKKGEFHNICGEPCRWLMMKLGEGSPPWTEADQN